jgi:thiamine biosynthesis lipoprotein
VIDLSYFNTAVRIETHDGQMSSDTINLIKNKLSALENSFSVSKENSIVARFNNSVANDSISLSSDEIVVFNKAKECYALTEGLFDPSVYPLVKLWQFSPYDPLKEFTLPTNSQIEDALSLLDFSAVALNDNKLNKQKDGVQIDLGGIVKGYASNAVSLILRDAGHSKGYVSIGGSSLEILQTQNFSIRHPRANADMQAIITFNCNGKTNLSVSTSGDYQRYHVKDGILYSHLINPHTGFPAQTGVISATVISDDGAFTDAVTTALCLTNHTPNDINSSELCSLIQKLLVVKPNSKIFAVYLNNQTKQVITNAKKGEDFTLLDTEYSVVNI